MIDLDRNELWLGDCEQPAAARLLATSPTADFVRGVLVSGGAAFLYADDGGIFEVDLRASTGRRIYTTPSGRDADCPSVPPPKTGPRVPAGTWIDHPIGLTDGGATLVLRRQPYLCSEAPSAFEVRVTAYRDPAQAREHVAHPIYGIAALGTVLYIADGGGLWRSADRGASWKAVPGHGLTGAPVQLAVAGDRLFARTTRGAASADPFPTEQGALFVTADGARWSRVQTPAEGDDDPGDGLAPRGVAWLAVPHRDTLVIGTLIAAAGKRIVAVEDQDLEQRAWSSSDRGATWAPTTAKPPSRPFTAAIGADVFEASTDGVVRIRDGQRSVVTARRSRPYRADLR